MKTSALNLHAQNAILYAGGIVFNLGSYVALREEGQRFLAGFDSLPAVLIVVLNSATAPRNPFRADTMQGREKERDV